LSYVALVTNEFEAVTRFYGAELGFPVRREWDQPNARGCLFDLHGLQLEILDNRREARQLELPPPGDRVHVVVEVDDVDAEHRRLGISAPAPVDTSWGTRLFRLRDPDGVGVTFLQWVAHPDGTSA
jgi:catechol 2,3-dioxygenase-like lactoylglutathione lyase family enzyme